jgi:hypothetical protein
VSRGIGETSLAIDAGEEVIAAGSLLCRDGHLLSVEGQRLIREGQRIRGKFARTRRPRPTPVVAVHTTAGENEKDAAALVAVAK